MLKAQAAPSITKYKFLGLTCFLLSQGLKYSEKEDVGICIKSDERFEDCQIIVSFFRDSSNGHLDSVSLKKLTDYTRQHGFPIIPLRSGAL